MTLYLSLDELCYERKLELKQAYICKHFANPSYDDIANADELVTEEMLREEYGNTDFVADDFFWKPTDKEVI